MQTNQPSTLRFKMISLIGLGGLMLAGFNQVSARYSMTQLQQTPLMLEVDVFRQSRGTSCGEAVIAMTYNYAYPATPISEQQVIEYATAQGYYTEALSPYTSPANMVNIAEYYTEDISTGTALSSGQGLGLIIQNLRDGDPVIIDVLSDFQDPESEAHFIVVTGISIDPNLDNAIVIHYNDPLTGTKASADWTGSHGVWNAWKTNQDPGGPGWWMVIHTPE